MNAGREPATRKNLVLVVRDHWFDPNDFLAIAREIDFMADDIDVVLVSRNDTENSIPGIDWNQPTLTVSFGMLGRFNPRRGRVMRNRAMPKLDQYSRCLMAGIPMPLTERFRFGTVYDPAVWGEILLLKPLSLTMTSHGAAQLMRAVRLNELSRAGKSAAPKSHILSQGPVLVQQFIDTGPNPIQHRVLTLFGEALYGTRNQSPIVRPDLNADDDVLEAAIVDPKHEAIKSQFAANERIFLHQDPEMFEFARKVYSAFASIPLQGCDILKDVRDGKLYLIEINAGGNTWHFSSKIFETPREALGGREALVNQLGAWRIAARVLVEKTRALAD